MCVIIITPNTHCKSSTKRHADCLSCSMVTGYPHIGHCQTVPTLPPGPAVHAAKFLFQLRQYLAYTSAAPFPASLRLSKRLGSSKRSSTRNADWPAEMQSKASFATTSVMLVTKDLSLPLES